MIFPKRLAIAMAVLSTLFAAGAAAFNYYATDSTKSDSVEGVIERIEQTRIAIDNTRKGVPIPRLYDGWRRMANLARDAGVEITYLGDHDPDDDVSPLDVITGDKKGERRLILSGDPVVILSMIGITQREAVVFIESIKLDTVPDETNTGSIKKASAIVVLRGEPN